MYGDIQQTLKIILLTHERKAMKKRFRKSNNFKVQEGNPAETYRPILVRIKFTKIQFFAKEDKIY